MGELTIDIRFQNENQNKSQNQKFIEFENEQHHSSDVHCNRERLFQPVSGDSTQALEKKSVGISTTGTLKEQI
jgi:hypothetical protein